MARIHNQDLRLCDHPKQVEGYARYFNNIKPPSMLGKGANYHLFKVRKGSEASITSQQKSDDRLTSLRFVERYQAGECGWWCSIRLAAF